MPQMYYQSLIRKFAAAEHFLAMVANRLNTGNAYEG
jgi:hypothetical protein